MKTTRKYYASLLDRQYWFNHEHYGRTVCYNQHKTAKGDKSV